MSSLIIHTLELRRVHDHRFAHHLRLHFHLGFREHPLESLHLIRRTLVHQGSRFHYLARFFFGIFAAEFIRKPFEKPPQQFACWPLGFTALPLNNLLKVTVCVGDSTGEDVLK